MTTDKKARKEMPMARGLLDYFPDACAAVANVSYVGNQQHNPGEEMHWAREKSKDHADCCVRHLVERGTMDEDGLRHSAKLAWRALALLQLEIERADDRSLGMVMGVCSTKPGLTTWQEPIFSTPIVKSYDGDWNMKNQSPGFFRIRGDRVSFVDSGGQETYYSVSNEFKRYIDLGSLVPNTWVPPLRPICYISGPMRGYADLNYPAFDRAKEIMEKRGYDVISPADMDRKDPTGTILQAWEYADRDYAALRRIAKEAIPGSCVVTLHGYERSIGATAEIAMARWLGINIRHIEEVK